MNTGFSFSVLVVLAFVSYSYAWGTQGDVACEGLCKNKCAFAVSSSGDRCVLEKQVRRSGEEKYVCKTSAIQANGLKNWIETNECIEACGLERKTLGISSDSLLESSFTGKLCSPQCYQNCPNVVDLYFNLAAGEGVFLPKLCEGSVENTRRGMSEMKSSGFVAPGPDSSVDVVSSFDAPAGAPYYI
uniref:PAR1 protein n=1 Tax=Kalanchoe fedtschenkoi TaxID=63787 RepID=A0A7N0U6B4_KALFE